MITSSPGLHSAVNTLCSECLAPLETTTCAGVYFRPCVASILLGDGRAQFGNAAGRGVVRVAGLHRGDGRLADVLGRGEVGLADAEVVDRLAGRLQLLGLGGHGQRGRRLQRTNNPRNRRHRTAPQKNRTCREFGRAKLPLSRSIISIDEPARCRLGGSLALPNNDRRRRAMAAERSKPAARATDNHSGWQVRFQVAAWRRRGDQKTLDYRAASRSRHRAVARLDDQNCALDRRQLAPWCEASTARSALRDGARRQRAPQPLRAVSTRHDWRTWRTRGGKILLVFGAVLGPTRLDGIWGMLVQSRSI